MISWNWQTITDWDSAQEVLRRARYGIIETSADHLLGIHLRPWPKLLSWPELWPVSSLYHAQGQTDRCYLYYNQPWSCPDYLALKYVVSTEGTPYATFRAALITLDAIAQLKKSDAIVCDVFNQRISERFLKRMGWESHKPQRWHRNYIKRFYGEYPEIRLPLASSACRT